MLQTKKPIQVNGSKSSFVGLTTSYTKPAATKNLSFIYPLTRRVKLNGKPTTELISNATINYSATPIEGGSRFDPLEDQFDILIEGVAFDGVEIDINIMNAIADNWLYEVEKACLNNAASYYYEGCDEPPLEDDHTPVEYLSTYKTA